MRIISTATISLDCLFLINKCAYDSSPMISLALLLETKATVDAPELSVVNKENIM